MFHVSGSRLIAPPEEAKLESEASADTLVFKGVLDDCFVFVVVPLVSSAPRSHSEIVAVLFLMVTTLSE